MDYSLLSHVVAELSQRLSGARVDRVFQGLDRDLYFLFRKDRNNLMLLLSPQRSLPRMHLVSSKPQISRDPHPFVLNLRSRLAGSRIVNVCLLNRDRVVEMTFEKGNDSYRLFVELTGMSSNLLFTDRQLKILALYYPTINSDHTSRVTLPGSLYVPPPKKDHQQSSRFGYDVDALRSPNKWAEDYYLDIVRRQRLEALKSELRSLAGKKIKKMERRRAALMGDSQDMAHADEYRQKGDLILAHLKQLAQGIDHADLIGFDGTSVPVRLDPKMSPYQNADHYFKKYKKAKTGLPLVRKRLDEAETEIHRLQKVLNDIELDMDVASLNHLYHAFADIDRSNEATRAKRRSSFRSVTGIKSILYGGWEILLGRSAAGNDYLTTKIARGDDLWLHADGMPGSHVIIRNPDRAEIPPTILMKAASIAAFYSKGREAGKVPVTYTKARFVRKPAGAKPGLVTLSQRNTIMVKPAIEPQR